MAKFFLSEVVPLSPRVVGQAAVSVSEDVAEHAERTEILYYTVMQYEYIAVPSSVGS